MEASEYDPHSQPETSPAHDWVNGVNGVNGRHRELIERAQVQLRSSAFLLRSNGKADQAHRAVQFADWADLHLVNPQVAQSLKRVLADSMAVGQLVDGVLEFALEVLHAERGNVQLADPVTGELTIAAHCGFGSEFLDYFAVVADDGSACGRAAHQRAQVVIADVTADPGFAPHRDIAAASGFRAVQSTPLSSEDGRLVGMVSTHYPRPVVLPGRELAIMRRLGPLIGEQLGTLLRPPRVAH
jgi:GAF domain-containing protein